MKKQVLVIPLEDFEYHKKMHGAMNSEASNAISVVLERIEMRGRVLDMDENVEQRMEKSQEKHKGVEIYSHNTGYIQGATDQQIIEQGKADEFAIALIIFIRKMGINNYTDKELFELFKEQCSKTPTSACCAA